MAGSAPPRIWTPHPLRTSPAGGRAEGDVRIVRRGGGQVNNETVREEEARHPREDKKGITCKQTH